MLLFVIDRFIFRLIKVVCLVCHKLFCEKMVISLLYVICKQIQDPGFVYIQDFLSLCLTCNLISNIHIFMIIRNTQGNHFIHKNKNEIFISIYPYKGIHKTPYFKILIISLIYVLCQQNNEIVSSLILLYCLSVISIQLKK